MRYLLILLILVNCPTIQGVLEWTVIGKVTDYGQNVTLFCNVSNCCPQEAGWDRWTPVQRTLFIDVKTGTPNKKYDGKVMRKGYTLIIQNLTKEDLNVSYSCLYGVTLGQQKLLLEEDVFTDISTTQPNASNADDRFTGGQIAFIIVGVAVLITVVVVFSVLYFWRRQRKKREKNILMKVEFEKEPLLTEDISKVVCIEGEDVILSCKLIHRSPLINWLKDGNEVLSNENCIMYKEDKQAKLKLKSTKRCDSGKYCVQVGKFSRNLQLHISDYFLEDPVNIDAIEGEDATLTCKVRPGSPSVKWLKDGEEIWINDNCEMYSEDSQQKLKFNITNKSNSGEYTVQVGNFFRKVQLKVTDYFLEDPSNVESIEGEDVIVSCKVRPGSQYVKWLKGCKEISPNENCKIYKEDTKNKLKLKNTKTSDSGEYFVQVGKFTRKVQLQITAYFIQDPSNVVCKEGDNAMFTCTTCSNSPSVIFLKDGKDITRKDNYEKSIDGTHHTFKVMNTTLSDEGEYSVQIGKSSRKVHLNIEEIPNQDEKEAYMNAMQSEKEDRRYVRIQVIGKDRVGKSSLVRRLLGQNIDDVASTDGIDIVRTCQIRTSDGEWMVGEVETELDKLGKRILHAVNKKQNSKETVSNQRRLSKDQVFETKKMQNIPNQNPSKDYVLLSEKKKKKLLHVHENKPLHFKRQTCIPETSDINAECNDNEPVKIHKTRNSGSSNKNLNVADTTNISSDKSKKGDYKVAEKKYESSQITEAMIDKMDDVLLYVKNKKEKMSSDGLVECGIWDFAGQKDYYATHQTFFTPFAIYILVVDIEDDINAVQNDVNFNFSTSGEYIDFWLDSIHCFRVDVRYITDNKLCPPVIMVCTGIDKVQNIEAKKDKFEKQFLKIFGQQKKSNHKRGMIHFISNKQCLKKDLEKLKKHISEIAEEMHYFAEELPTKWIELENTLLIIKDLNIKKNMGYCEKIENIEKIAQKMSIQKDELIRFLNYQHKIGNIIFFEDKRDHIILQPNWLVDCFRCLMCDDLKKHISPDELYELKYKGMLSEKMIDNLFSKVPALRFGDHKTHILDVMGKFDIIIKSKLTNSYYMPCMIEHSLSIQQIKQIFKVQNYNCTPWLIFEFKFLPIGFYNQILFSYIRNYDVCEIDDHQALYAGKAVVFFDRSKFERLIICFSRNALSIQIWKSRPVDGDIYQHVVKELCKTIDGLNGGLYQLDYDIKTKCSDGDYSVRAGRMCLDDMTSGCKEGEYFCEEHQVIHSMDDIENIWLKNIPSIIDQSEPHPSEQQVSLSSRKTEIGRKTKEHTLPTEEDALLHAVYIVLYTIPNAIECYIDKEYKGGFVQAICDYKDQLKATLSTEEWELLSRLIVHHRLYHFYDQIIQDTVLDNEVLDLLISRCILRIDDRAEIEHHPRQSDRNKCILDLLIQRPQDSYSVLLEVLKESSSCSKDLIECMEGQQLSHHEVLSQSKVKSCTNIQQLTNRPGFQSLVTIVSMVKAEQISDTEPESHDSRLAADLCRLQSWYNKIIKMSSMDLDKYQQFVQTVNEILGRISGNSYPVVKETTLSTVMQKQVKKMLHSLKEKEEYSELKEKLNKMETDLGEIIPKNIRELIKKQVEDWEKKDKMFVSTRASDYVMEQLQDNSCLTLTAPSGVGKSFIARHTALFLKKQGYNIIPVYSPTDIRDYYHPGKQTVFIVDDICGNFTANQQQVENWQQLLPVIKTIIADKCCKIIVSCRLQVYKDDKFNLLSPFKSCECNLISDKLCLTSVEKNAIAKTYIGSSLDNIDKLSQNSEFFPLLCSLYDRGGNGDVEDFFKNPFNVYQNELDNLSRHGDEGILRICSLALCVIFNNQLDEKWFRGKLTDQQKHIIDNICDAWEINRITSKAKLQTTLDILDGTYICKQNGIYRTLHDKLFDFLAHYFGQKAIECLIDHGDSNLVHERFIWQNSPDNKNSNIDYIIEIPDDYLESYLERFIQDWSAGKVRVIFMNNNMSVPLFRKHLLQHLKQMEKSQQVTLANTKDTVLPKEHHGSGTTPLILTCYDGYTDMVHWLLHNDVDVDHCRDDGVTGLYMASQEGHSDIVKLLLERNPNVDLCNNDGRSPLFMASQEGRTDIVKLLLEKDPNVDLCDNDGCIPLLQASYKGYTDIVKLLLDKDPNVDLCDKDGFTPLIQSCNNYHTSIVQLLMTHKPNINAQTFDGGNALYFSALNGNLEITQLLLENNADSNICIHSKQVFTDTVIHHPLTLDEIERFLFDSLIENTSSHVTEYVNKKSVDYAFDVVAGSSPLHIACFTGRIDVVHCLLDHNANINITKENGITPLFNACEVGHEDIVCLLLDKGADSQICRLDGESPLTIARDNGHTSIVMMLTNHTKKEDKLSF